jgi:hypothetical protein
MAYGKTPVSMLIQPVKNQGLKALGKAQNLKRFS